MNKPDVLKIKGISELSSEEMLKIHGGGAVDYLMKFASWGATYFFHMGLQEGRKMRDLM